MITTATTEIGTLIDEQVIDDDETPIQKKSTTASRSKSKSRSRSPEVEAAAAAKEAGRALAVVLIYYI